jgi:flagellar biosynthetic protein FliQ
METDQNTISLMREAVNILIIVSAPILLLSMFIGLIISLFQALTQLQESTLSFVPKILIIYVSLIFLTPFIYKKLFIFTENIIHVITG